MSAYIEREALKNDIATSTEPFNIGAVFRAINRQPSADVAPVVHGQWISLTKCSNAGVYCSICHKKVYKEDYAWCNRKNKLRSSYCPNCGAKMNGGDSNADSVD